jgi:hypothetical protein
MMNTRYLAIAIVAMAFLLGAVWVNLGQNTTKLALAPEISATKTQRGFGVLGFQDKTLLNLGSVADLGDYRITIKDRKVIDISSTTKALEYTIVFDLAKLNAGDIELSQFLTDRLGKTFLTLVDSDDKVYAMQDLGGMPTKTVRFLVDKPEAEYSIDFQSAEMQKAGTKAISWKSK